ncbi:unnamed protein product, partial [Mesorhabditis belari]|uniref:FAD synthase n=1 Tax=Mesorhabditis belari TaxID=2138241 RepID=A0AAF3J2Q0_9BILA
MSAHTIGGIKPRSTAAIIVIGDEILKGSTLDTNSHFLCKRLHKLGVVVRKIHVIGDEVNSISNEIKELHTKVDFLFTTGGIGPTHDDKTFLGLAKAFEDELVFNEEIASAVSSLSKKTEPNKGFIQKLSTIPRSATLRWGREKGTGERGKYPIVQVKNIVAFPGVPRFCELAFDNIEEELFPSTEFRPIFRETIYANKSEFEFSDELTKTADNFEGRVEIGSYPDFNNNYYKTKLIVESENEEDGAKAVEELKKIIAENLVYYDAKPWLNTVQKWNAFRERKLVSNPNFVKSLDGAMACIDGILDEYSLNQIALSFNGGKDCTVLLHMLRVAIDKYGPGQKIAGFHIVCDDQFPELTQFIIDAAKMYNIVVMELPGPLIIGVSSLKEQRPQIVPVLMGSRASDPNGKYMKSKVEWTDSDWPRVLRVCPILPWSYQDVWMMLRGLCVHYCQLYDQGYTSLGGRETTVPNEMLRIESSGNIRYCPAYTLNDGNEERKGRKNK